MAQVGAVAAALPVPENRGKLALFGGVKECPLQASRWPRAMCWRLRCEIVRPRWARWDYGMAARLCGRQGGRQQAELTFALSAPKTDAAR